MGLSSALGKKDTVIWERWKEVRGQTRTVLGTWQRNSDLICREVGTRWRASALQDVNSFKDSKM